MEESQKPVKDALLPGSIIVAALLIAGALVYNTGLKNVGNQASLEENTNTFSAEDLIDDDVILGDPNAPVTIVEFGDYQCPFCARFFAQTEPQIREEYIKTGKAKMVYRDFAFLGPESLAAANASQCAAEQGKFWAYHDRLFETELADGREHNGNLNATLFKSLAAELGLDQTKFNSCLASEKYKDEIQKDYDDGIAAGVRGTPHTFINGKPISGALSYSSFKQLIEESLAAAR
ncbi:MAG: thioredoxin domain-containing protein [Candidatus Harrisonbacteria bacterium]|nr:thioredoxin domain-containing protein [Candidatus Harrisonbacteria bacterium]